MIFYYILFLILQLFFIKVTTIFALENVKFLQKILRKHHVFVVVYRGYKMFFRRFTQRKFFFPEKTPYFHRKLLYFRKPYYKNMVFLHNSM